METFRDFDNWESFRKTFPKFRKVLGNFRKLSLKSAKNRRLRRRVFLHRLKENTTFVQSLKYFQRRRRKNTILVNFFEFPYKIDSKFSGQIQGNSTLGENTQGGIPP